MAKKQESTLIFISKDQTKVKQIKISRNKLILYTIIALIFLSFTGKYAIDLLIEIRYDSKIDFLERTNDFLKAQLKEMSGRISSLNDHVANIEKKDDDIRMIIGVNEMAEDVRDVGIGGSDYDYKLQDNILDVQTADDLNSQLVQLDKLDREVKLELESYNGLVSTYYAKEDSIRHMPAMHPVIEGRITSEYGMRLHPIFKRYRKHPGVDFAAKMGTPIYAAADGVVKLARYNGGYGNCVFIDHLYGFETRYGHMEKILVRAGQRVKRGEKIGLVGKSGIATAPHLHFEVHYKGKEVNPRNYFFDDASLNRMIVEENRQ